MITPTIQTLPEKKLIGQHITMSLANNKTQQLWQGFMPRKKEIQNAIDHVLYSMQVYDGSYFEKFDVANSFEKWAAREVTNFEVVPHGMQTYTIPAGLYAVFLYKGLSTDTAIFQYIYGTWLPASDYQLEHRPHFEILGEKYKNNDPNSEEEIWLPIKLK